MITTEPTLPKPPPADADRGDRAVHRFLVRGTDSGYVGFVDGGRLLEWIDKVGFEAAARWSGRYCVTAYVGNIHLERPISVGELVELDARVIHTGTSSIHILVTVYSSDPADTTPDQRAQCLMVFVAVDDSGRSVPVPTWQPGTMTEMRRNRQARERIALRRRIEDEMAAVRYTDRGTAPETLLRFMAAPTDINWGGKVHGGRLMRWIDEAGFVCGSQWRSGPVIASYFGGIRFYTPVRIGQVVEITARLLYTGPYSMHLGVHLHATDTDTRERRLAAHALAVFVGFDAGAKQAIPQWLPRTDEDQALRDHALRLIRLRSGAEPMAWASRSEGGSPN
jgi:acyl-CoA hydrolase